MCCGMRGVAVVQRGGRVPCEIDPTALAVAALPSSFVFGVGGTGAFPTVLRSCVRTGCAGPFRADCCWCFVVAVLFVQGRPALKYSSFRTLAAYRGDLPDVVVRGSSWPFDAQDVGGHYSIVITSMSMLIRVNVEDGEWSCVAVAKSAGQSLREAQGKRCARRRTGKA